MVVLSLVCVPLVVRWYEHRKRGSYPDDVHVFTLTGVARDGVWTAEEVAGHNYWRHHFSRAKIQVETGEKVLLRLKSSDVTHYFSSPKLGIELVEVQSGYLEEVTFTAGSPGSYLYFCEAICGDCHYYMRGVIEVLPKSSSGSGKYPAVADLTECHLELEVLPEDDTARHGGYLYRKLGCVACHEGPGVGTGINIPADHRYEGSKVKRAWLENYLLGPHSIRWKKDGVRPYIQMPDFYLSETEARNLAAYLMGKEDKELIPPSGIDWDAPASKEEISEGRQLYKQYQCQACHQLGGVGQKIGPAHDGVGSRLQPEYMYRWVLDPQKIVPGTPMPNKGLWEEEARAVVRYLETLQKEDEK